MLTNVRLPKFVPPERTVSTPWEASSVSPLVRSGSDWTVAVSDVRILMSARWDSLPASWEPHVSTPWDHTDVPVAPDTRRSVESARI